MSLYVVTFDQTAQPEDLNQVVNVLQEPAGATEQGEYWLNAGGNASDQVSQWMASRSQNTSPVSASVNTSLHAPTTNIATPVAANQSSYGVQIATHLTATSTNETVAGIWTIQY